LAFNNNNNYYYYYTDNTQDHIYGAIIYGANSCETSLWVLWAKVSRLQVSAKSYTKLHTRPLSTPIVDRPMFYVFVVLAVDKSYIKRI